MENVPELHNAALIGLQKQDGGVRPIAIGEAWFRVIKRHGNVHNLTRPETSATSSRRSRRQQLRRARDSHRACSSCVGRAIHTGLAAEADCITIKVDFKNAFNSISRMKTLEAVRKRGSNLLPFTQWCYRQHTRLFIQGADNGTAPSLSQHGVSK
jgi:hypothetical protein